MKKNVTAGLALVALLAGCQSKTPVAPTATDTVDANAFLPQPSPAPSPKPDQAAPPPPLAAGTPATPGGLPDDRTPLPEPTGPINPKSGEGAGQVMQTYGALLEEKKFGQAWALWSGGGQASGLTRDQFAAAYAKYRDIHAEVGKPGRTDGAAGSIYIEVPFRLYGTLKSGNRFNLLGPVTLRRVNDVAGATPAQLRWHIASSGLKPRP